MIHHIFTSIIYYIKYRCSFYLKNSCKKGYRCANIHNKKSLNGNGNDQNNEINNSIINDQSTDLNNLKTDTNNAEDIANLEDSNIKQNNNINDGKNSKKKKNGEKKSLEIPQPYSGKYNIIEF